MFETTSLLASLAKRIRRSWSQFAIAFIIFVMGLAGAAVAQDRMELAGDYSLSYEGGSLNSSGSGTISNVIFYKGRDALWNADSMEIDGSGQVDGVDWVVNQARITNFEMPLNSFYAEAIEAQNVRVGRLLGVDEPAGDLGVADESSSIRFMNTTTAIGRLIFEIDIIATRPFIFTNSPQGRRVPSQLGFDLDGISTRNRDALSIDNPDSQAPWIAMQMSLNTRFEGEQMFVKLDYDAQIRELADWTLELDMAAKPSFFDELVPLFVEISKIPAPGVLVSEASANGGELVITDTGLINFALNVMAEEAGVSSQGLSGDLFRSTARQNVRRRLDKWFPDNAAALFTPIDAMLENGGRLTLTLDPQSPVAFSSMLAYAFGADRAIDELGVSVAHQPR